MLDICSRTGNGALYFLKNKAAAKALCADFSPRFQVIARERLEDSGFSCGCALVEKLPFPFVDRQFDGVLCLETIEHVACPEAFLKELGRVINPGGSLILSTPNVLWGPAHSLAAIFNIHHSEGPHRFIRRKALLGYIRAAGFEVVREKTTVLIPAGPAILVKIGEYIEKKLLPERIIRFLGLRRIFLCRKS